jgi:homoserine acetyltransferase
MWAQFKLDFATAYRKRYRSPKEQDQACLASSTTHKENEQQQLLVVAGLSGSEIAHERNMQHEKEWTPGLIEKDQPYGRSPMGQGMMRRGG